MGSESGGALKVLADRSVECSYRQANAPHLFLGAYQPTPKPRTLVAYIASTLSSAQTLSHDSMFTHVPGGSSVCIHALATVPHLQRRGIALGLLKEYISRLEQDRSIERVLLICHEDLLLLYEKAGFELVGKSSVVHGAREWFEMRRVLRPATLSDVSSIPQHVLAAALSARPNARPPGTLLSSVADVNELTIEADGDRTNKYPIVCVQEGCGSLILQAKTARLCEAPSVEVRDHILESALGTFDMYDTARTSNASSPGQPPPSPASGGKRFVVAGISKCDGIREYRILSTSAKIRAECVGTSNQAPYMCRM